MTVTRRPNLFIVGAAKCGTTALHHALSQHPDIFMSRLKEPGFFVPEFRYHPKDEAWYESLFADGEGRAYRGESSTHYAKLPLYQGVPERVHRYAPDARVLYVMRDPTERAISHYWHNTRSTRPEFHEERPMLEAVRADANYRNFGDFPMQLRPWLDRFGERVRPIVFEELTATPAAVLAELLEWLGLPPADLTLEALNTRNGRARRPALVERVRRSRLWDRMAPLVPRGLRRRATAAMTVAPAPTAAAAADEADDVRELLRPWATAVIESTEGLLGRPLPWPSFRRGNS